MLFSLGYKDVLELMSDLNYLMMLLSFVSWVLIFTIYFKILTSLLNQAYDTIQKGKSNGYKATKINNFIVYFGIVLTSTVIHIGIVFLVIHILLRIW
jgi:hypothetical protein